YDPCRPACMIRTCGARRPRVAAPHRGRGSPPAEDAAPESSANESVLLGRWTHTGATTVGTESLGKG
ncbi:MAG: hypothetical protein AB7R99_26975, partial [Pseudonocardia sp.]